MRIALATDHAGFDKLQVLQDFISSLGHSCQNFGPTAFDPDDDYPSFMFAAAQAVASGDCQRGVIFGSSGQGEAMAANRIKGVRCALFYGPTASGHAIDAEGHVSDDPLVMLQLSREHNNANMLSLAARFLSMDDIQTAVKLWLSFPDASAERHLRRVAQLDNFGS